LAKDGANKNAIDVPVEININSNNDPIDIWCKQQMNNRWNNTSPSDYKHSKKYIKNVDDKLSKQLINLTRKELRVAIGLITGHDCLKNSINRMKNNTNLDDEDDWEKNSCRFCRECDTENTKHVLEECSLKLLKRVTKSDENLVTTFKYN
jgi:hypothetical protein